MSTLLVIKMIILKMMVLKNGLKKNTKIDVKFYAVFDFYYTWGSFLQIINIYRLILIVNDYNFPQPPYLLLIQS